MVDLIDRILISFPTYFSKLRGILNFYWSNKYKIDYFFSKILLIFQ